VRGLFDVFWFLNMIIYTIRERQRRREWDAGRAARMQAEIDRSDRYIKATFPSPDPIGAPEIAPDLSTDKEAP